MKYYNSKHKYTKEGFPNIHYKYNIKYLGVDTNNGFAKLFKHRRSIEKHGYTYIRKVYKWILRTVKAEDIPQIKAKPPKFNIKLETRYFINPEGKKVTIDELLDKSE